ncbi:hypothetical protein M513_13401 [Trichuris suis]|uniref:Uncharacterized protein n=1 Tax=Trichuris suis TaxID=68888 RepID=A0A085LL77_9BILA|nr:hypothetical protein M513_13401 [Trichuris suis]
MTGGSAKLKVAKGGPGSEKVGKHWCKARSEADNDGKTARGGSRRGGERTANVQLSINWIHEKKRLLTSYCDILSPQLGKIFESDSSKENMTKTILSHGHETGCANPRP